MPRSDGVLRTAIFVAALSCLAGPILVAQDPARGAMPQAPPPPVEGTSAVSGVVLDATTHEPVAGVLVYLGSQGRGAVGRLSRQISDDKGRFIFTDLPAANNYFINASKPGYLEGHYGVGAGGLLGGLIAVVDGQWFADATVMMQRPGAISGTILDEHGEPAVGVFVRVLAKIRVAGQMRLAAGQVTKTDDRGVYRLADLTPGRYVVQVPIVQQSVSPAMTAVDIAGISPDQVAQGRGVPDPPPALDISAATRLIVGGYLTPPSPVDGRPLAYLPIFYPGVPQLSAAGTIELAAGEEHGSVDLSLRAAPSLSISGVVEGPSDVLPGLVVRLMPDGLEDLGGGSEVATATLGADGRFTLLNVPAGSYLLDARRTISELQYRSPLATPAVPLPATPGTGIAGSGSGPILSGPYGANYSTRSTRGNAAYFAQMRVTVDARPLTDLVVPLRRGATIRGKVVDESGAPPAAGAQGLVAVYAEPADGNLGLGMPSATRPTPNTFEIQGLIGGQYLLRFLGSLGSIMSVVADGEDHRIKPFDGSAGSDFDVVVTVTDKRTDLSGTAADASGQQVKNAIAIAFPVERDQWTNYGLSSVRLKSSPTSSAGVYRFQSLPAGEYYVAAVPPEQADVWQDPAKLAILAGSAARVRLAWGDVKTQAVTVIRLP